MKQIRKFSRKDKKFHSITFTDIQMISDIYIRQTCTKFPVYIRGGNEVSSLSTEMKFAISFALR